MKRILTAIVCVMSFNAQADISAFKCGDYHKITIIDNKVELTLSLGGKESKTNLSLQLKTNKIEHYDDASIFTGEIQAQDHSYLKHGSEQYSFVLSASKYAPLISLVSAYKTQEGVMYETSRRMCEKVL